MIQQQFIDQLSQQLTKLLKASPLNDLENNCKALLHATFAKLDLVTREEFDVQQNVLANTREKLEQLELVVKRLETENEHR